MKFRYYYFVQDVNLKKKFYVCIYYKMNTTVGLHSFLVVLVLVMLFMIARDLLVGLAQTALGRITLLIAIVYVMQYDVLVGLALTGFFLALIEYSYSREGFVDTPSDEETGKEPFDDDDNDDEADGDEGDDDSKSAVDISDANEQITAQLNVTPKDSNK